MKALNYLLLLLLTSFCNVSAQIIETIRPPQVPAANAFINTSKGQVRDQMPAVRIDPQISAMEKEWNVTLSQHGIDHGSEIPQDLMDSIKHIGNSLKRVSKWLKLGRGEERTVTDVEMTGTPLINNSFKGNAYNGWAPPDNNIAVSDEGYIVSVINTSLLFTDVNGNILLEKNFDDFLAFLGLTGVYFDPKVIYDPMEDKFIVVILNGNTSATSNVVIGFSSASDPMQTWWFYTFDGDPTGSNLWFDYPSIGVSTDDLYISGNLYADDRSYSQVLIYQFDKGPGFYGEPLDGIHWNDVRDAHGNVDFTVVPISFGFDGSIGPGIYFISTNSDGANQVMLYYTDATATNNPNMHVFSASVPKYYVPWDGLMKGTTDKIKTNDCRVLTGFYADGTLHFAFNNRGDDLHVKVYYCRLNTSDLTQTSISFGQTPYEYAYPAIAPFSSSVTDKSVLISYLRSSGSIYPEFRAAVFDNDMNLAGSFLVKEGESFVDFAKGTTERWGDYSGIARRHTPNGAEVWVSGCYAEDFDGGAANILSNWIAQVTDGTVQSAPVANFSADKIEILAGQSVVFTDHSTNNPTSWQWTFPGGMPSTSSERNPIVTYQFAGVYDVALSVSNAAGSDEIVKLFYIDVSESVEAPIAGFTSDFTYITPGETVHFSDLSINNPTSWDWVFPGGTPALSALQNPDVTYTQPGCYDVTLIVSNAAGNHSLTRQCHIDVSTTGVEEADTVFSNFIVYPNPVTPGGSITIEFELSQPAELDFSIVDATGASIKNLARRYIKAGLTNLSFSTGALTAGTYAIVAKDKKNSLLRSKTFFVNN